MLVIFIGIIIVFIGALIGAGKGESKFAVGGFVGVFPFALWNDRRLGIAVILISVLMFIVWMVLQFRIGNH